MTKIFYWTKTANFYKLMSPSMFISCKYHYSVFRLFFLNSSLFSLRRTWDLATEQEQFLPVAQAPRCLPLLPDDTPTSRFNQSLSTSLAVSYSKSLSHNKLTQKQNTKVKYALGVSGFLFSMVTGPQNYRLQKLDDKRLYCASHFNKTAEPSFFQTFHFCNTTV